MTKQILIMCTCVRCGFSAPSIEGTQHRRCGGAPNAPPRAKVAKAPCADRGTWGPFVLKATEVKD